jgi:CRISPR type III-A-associated RAMP protein Csm5
VQNGKGICFIPGSSIKGAIRNAVLWQIMGDAEKNGQFNSFVKDNLGNVNRLRDGDKKREFVNKFSCQEVNGMTLQSKSFTEKIPEWNEECQVLQDKYDKLWGAANEVLRDFLRVVKITDANFVDKPCLEDKPIGTFCRNGAPSTATFNLKQKSQLKMVVEKSKARFKITIDDKLANEFFPSGLPGYLRSVDDLLKIINDFFAAVTAEEKIFYGAVEATHQVEDILDFYKSLFPPVNETFRFRIGWGGGMMSKTQFLHLDQVTRSNVRNLIMPRDTQVAPKSRCLLIDDNRQPLKPLGWCALKVLTGTTACYPGIDAYKQSAGGIPKIAQPQGTVRAIIITTGKPAMVKILEGDFSGYETILPGIQLQNLGLMIDSEIFLKLIIIKKKIIKVEYKGKA